MKNKTTIDYIEIWPENPEDYIRRSCETWGLQPPVSFTPGKIGNFDNLVLDATLADGRIYRLCHSPIQERSGPIANRKRTRAEMDYISRVRAAAGRAGAAARWAGVERRETTLVRIYSDDAARLKAMPGSIADAVRRLVRGCGD